MKTSPASPVPISDHSRNSRKTLALLCLLALAGGCKTVDVSLFPPSVHGHTGNPPIVVDHGDHTEVIP